MKPAFNIAMRTISRISSLLVFTALAFSMLGGAPARSATPISPDMEWYQASFGGVYAFSADRSIAAVSKTFGLIDLYHTSDGSWIRTIYTNCVYGTVDSLAFSPDGTMLACTVDYGKVQLWKLSDGSLLRAFTNVSLANIVFSPDSQTIAGSYGSTVRVIRVSDGSVVRNYTGHTGSPGSIVFSPDGQLLASGSYDNSVRVWRVSTGASVKVIQSHTDDVNQVAFSPDGTKLASASDDQTLKVWNVADWSLITSISDPEEILSVAFSADNSRLAYGEGYYGAAIVQIDTQNWQVIDTPITSPAVRIVALAYSADGQHLIFGTDYNECIFCSWNAMTGEGDYTLRTNLSDSLYRCFLSPDGLKAITAQDSSSGESFSQWNGITGVFEGDLPYQAYYDTIAFSPDSSIMARVDDNDNIILVNNVTGDVLRTLSSPNLQGAYDLKFSNDGSLVAGRDGDYVAVWNVATGALLQEFDAGDSVEQMAFSPDGSKFAILNDSLEIQYWLLADGSQIWHAPLNPTTPAGVPVWDDYYYAPIFLSVSPDGLQIAVFVENKGVRYFSTTAGAYISSWISNFYGAIVSPDWQQMISWDSGNVITVSRFTDHQVIETRKGHIDGINDVSVSADMTKLLSIGYAGELALWDITPPYLPDLMIKAAADTDYIGRRLFYGDASQRVDASGNISTPAVYHVRLMNAGFNKDNIVLKGSAGHDGWSVRYFNALTGGNDITAQVTGGGWRVVQAAGGATRDIRVEVKPSHQGFAGDIIDVDLWATSDSNPDARYDRVYTTTSALEHVQPDLQVKNRADAIFVGDNIYSDNGTPQLLSKTANPGVTMSYDFVIQNDSNVPDTFKVTGQGGGSGWTVRYFKDFDDFAEITDAVTGGGWSTGELAVDATLAFHAEVTSDSSVAGYAQKTLLIRTESTAFAGPIDVGKVVQTNAKVALPDMTIRAGEGSVVGAGIYANDGAGQTVSFITPVGQAARYYFTVTNRGNTADKFLIRGTVGGSNWTVKYFNAAGADVTSSVTLTSYSTPTLAVGASYAMRAEVTPNLYIEVNAQKELLISATSNLNSALVDAVRAVTTKMPLASVRLQASPSQGSGVNMPITLTAIPTGGKTIEYQFSVTDPNEQTTVVRAYGLPNPYVWTPTIRGNHVVTVWAREVGDPAPYNASATLTYYVPDVQLRGVLIAGEVQPGLDLLFTATPQGGGDQVQYKFRIASGSVWTDLQPYGASRTYDWIPTRIGNYTVRAYAKETRNGRTLEFYRDLAIRVTSIPPPPARLTAVLLEALPASPQLANTPITLTATPTGGANVEYRFRILNGSVWSDLQPYPYYGPENSIVWTPTERKTYTINVYAHEIDTPYTSAVMKSITFNVY